jgi:hypothetical protein
MDCSIGKISQMMQELVLDLFGNLVSFFNRDLWTYGYIQLRMESVA